VTIVADEQTKKLYDDVTKLAKLRLENYKLGSATWGMQFHEALFQVSEEEDEDYEPTKMDVVMHVITVPWKLFFALVPPTDYWGGKVCFFVALAFIAIVTCLIGDLAAIFGCLVGISDSTTAITLVALGTSLPDTFASKAAAVSDDNADASIGNVTGSNGVNVFLGIGVPWAIAALVWQDRLADTESPKYLEWANRVSSTDSSQTFGDLLDSGDFPMAGFVVEGGSLGISVVTFCLCAGIAISVLYYRRVTFGAELGGPAGGFLGANMTAGLFACLWLTYIIVSIVSS